MLLDLFKDKKCFKLVCGAGNEDEIEVEKLVTLYSKAGCNFFDLCAKPEIVDAAKRGLKRAGIETGRYLCVSVGIAGDPHVSKAVLDKSTCISCEVCSKVCSQDAIVNCEINTKRCIGCKQCVDICPSKSIVLVSEPVDLKEVLPPLVKKGIDCIEFHAFGEDEKEVDEKWDDIHDCYDGPLSINIDRYKLGNDRLIARVNRMLERRSPYTTIIQTDGKAMSGGEDDFKTTLQAIAIGELFQDENMPVYIMLSGGTNTKTTELARQCGINCNGVAVGMFARKIVKEYIKRDDFFENEEVFEKALKIAKNLVDKSLENMGD